MVSGPVSFAPCQVALDAPLPPLHLLHSTERPDALIVTGQHFATFHTDFILQPGLPSLMLQVVAGALLPFAAVRRWKPRLAS